MQVYLSDPSPPAVWRQLFVRCTEVLLQRQTVCLVAPLKAVLYVRKLLIGDPGQDMAGRVCSWQCGNHLPVLKLLVSTMSGTTSSGAGAGAGARSIAPPSMSSMCSMAAQGRLAAAAGGLSPGPGCPPAAPCRPCWNLRGHSYGAAVADSVGPARAYPAITSATCRRLRKY